MSCTTEYVHRLLASLPVLPDLTLQCPCHVKHSQQAIRPHCFTATAPARRASMQDQQARRRVYLSMSRVICGVAAGRVAVPCHALSSVQGWAAHQQSLQACSIQGRLHSCTQLSLQADGIPELVEQPGLLAVEAAAPIGLCGLHPIAAVTDHLLAVSKAVGLPRTGWSCRAAGRQSEAVTKLQGWLQAHG